MVLAEDVEDSKPIMDSAPLEGSSFVTVNLVIYQTTCPLCSLLLEVGQITTCPLFFFVPCLFLRVVKKMVRSIGAERCGT
jgi:hypothetical protein